MLAKLGLGQRGQLSMFFVLHCRGKLSGKRGVLPVRSLCSVGQLGFLLSNLVLWGMTARDEKKAEFTSRIRHPGHVQLPAGFVRTAPFPVTAILGPPHRSRWITQQPCDQHSLHPHATLDAMHPSPTQEACLHTSLKAVCTILRRYIMSLSFSTFFQVNAPSFVRRFSFTICPKLTQDVKRVKEL